MLVDAAISGDRNMIKKKAENFLKYKFLIIEIKRMRNVKAKNDTSINRGNWSHLKITQAIPEQHTGKPRSRRNCKKG